MGWNQYVRQVAAANRRHEREAARRFRELAKQRAQYEKEQRLRQAADEVAEFDTYLEVLQSLHTVCGNPWDWRAVSTTPPPTEPTRACHREQFAQVALQAYQPGFFERLFGGAKRQRAQLENAVAQARLADTNEYEHALAAFQRDYAFWNTNVHLAPRVMKYDLAGCRDALAHAAAFEELEAFRIETKLVALTNGIATVECVLKEDDIVPNEEVKLTAGGKLSKKDMPVSRYWPLYQDHVCSSAIRAARETFAVLPLERAIVNMRSVRLNTSTGYKEPQTILGVHFVRATLSSLRLDSIDPSDAMKNFPHRMKFKKTTGFETVDPVTIDEQWVTT